MSIFTPPELDQDVLNDVVDEVSLLCEESEATLPLIANDPKNRDLLDKLFRYVHTIKGDVGIAQFEPLMPLLMAFEDLLQMVREGQLEYTSPISELLLSIFDHVKSFADDCARYGKAHYDADMFDNATESIAKVRTYNVAKHSKFFRQAIDALDPPLDARNSSELLAYNPEELRVDWADELEPDLVFFNEIAQTVERRLDNWNGRSNRQLKLALLLNQYAGKPIDESQLRAAVYLHDIGMSIIPISLFRQKGSLLESEVNRVRGHVIRSAGFLREMPHWEQAQLFIYQHHEQPNGQGYPEGLSNDEISHGARVIAIVDAFEAMTHNRPNSDHTKRPMTLALEEINSKSGSQFCPYWVNVLNHVMKEILPAS
ncbi:HD domain-containing phosphohydrolase [Vibrio hannami]|uniref:HD-GYP domain-containing protein n=1 Tax=Vibrio hannami TaxID=2717094 RepID=UPI00240FE54D|nr:HD domain-containing phosphohydrolase [Vibrio hannami]MDG3085088.1 HD domain-containing phosphohydrolase [Vibrio hannami]